MRRGVGENCGHMVPPQRVLKPKLELDMLRQGMLRTGCGSRSETHESCNLFQDVSGPGLCLKGHLKVQYL